MKKRVGIMTTLFVLIMLMMVGVVIKNKAYNERKNKLEFTEDIIKDNEVHDTNIAVRICPRGGDEKDKASWYHSYHKPGEDESMLPHKSAATIYELTVTNLSDDVVTDWAARIYFPEDLMFNSGWNGDFILHQLNEDKEESYKYNDNNVDIKKIPFEYYNDQSVLLIPMDSGEYFDYQPSIVSAEVPIAASPRGSKKYADKTIGFIVYVNHANVKDVITFKQGYITYQMHRNLMKEPTFWVVCALGWAWFMSVIVMVILRIKYKKLENERRVMEEMVHKFETDPLTKVYTRQAFFHYADELLKNKEKNYMVALVEIDNFKLTRNHYGEKICDDFLIYLAEYYKRMLPDAILGRYSRSRFSILLEMKESEKIDVNMMIAKDMIAQSPMPNQILKVGVYEQIDKSKEIRRCCDRASLALSKIQGIYGKNISYYEDTLENKLIDEHIIREDMEQALIQHQFLVYYQPKNDAKSGKLVGAEALVRWLHPEYGFMSPGQFIPVFEKSGFITQLDSYVFERVCTDIMEWKKKGYPAFPVSINISRKDFYAPNWLEEKCAFVETCNLDPKLIHLEVTESLYAEDPELIKQKVKWAKEKGYHVEMDDFGSGYSTLGMLADLSFDILKLDISFMRSMGKTDVVVASVIELAHKLGLATIAEGVETETQYQTINKLGCDIVQGYYFSKPLSKDMFEKYVLENK